MKAKMPDRVAVENTPRYTSASKGLAERAIRTIGEQLRTLRYDAENRYKTQITPESTVCHGWLDAGFCVTRCARGGGGITPFRAAHDRDYTQELAPFAETVLFKIMAPEHRGLSSGNRLHKGGKSRIWLDKSEMPKNGATKQKIQRLEPTKRLETSLLLEIQEVPWDLVPNAPRRGRRKIHPTPAPSCRQSTETRQIRPLKRQHIFVVIIRHGTVRVHAQTDSRRQQQKRCERSDSESSCQVVHTDQASS